MFREFARLTPCNCRAEDVRIFPIVISERKLCDVQREILAADLVERAHDAALQERPETLNCVCMDRTDNVASGAVTDSGVREFLPELAIGRIVVGTKQTYFGRNCLANEFRDGRFVSAQDNARDYVALALHGADNRSLA